MAFFVLDKDPDSGTLRLPLDATFSTREEALGALSAAAAAGEASVTGQVYVVDLDSALPVLVMPTPVATPAQDVTEAEPDEPVAEAEAEEPEVDESVAEVAAAAEPVGEEPVADAAEAEEPGEKPVAEVAEAEEAGQEPSEEPVVEAEAEAEAEPELEVEPTDEGKDMPFDAGIAAGGASLSEALKRAASSLEDEGIIAPESINAADFSFEDDLVVEDVVEGAPAEQVDTPATEAPDVETPDATATEVAEPMSASSTDSDEVTTAPADWPWANVEAFTGTTGSDAGEGEATPSDVDEPDTLITSAPPLGEEAYVPRPVILGDYADLPAADGDAALDEGALEGEVTSDEVASEQVVAEEVVEAAADADVEAPVEDAPALGSDSIADTPTEMAYEPTGELDMDAYTCNDCVYANTCPKVGEVTPANCGTFQWRAT